MDTDLIGATMHQKLRQLLTRQVLIRVGIVLVVLVGMSTFLVGHFSAHAAGNVQINAGGAAVSPFIADANYAGGATATSTNTIDTSGATNPAPQSVYQSNRYGNFTYTIPNLGAGAGYNVRLHFAETYWTASGQRTFNVSINTQQVLSKFDIIAAAGAANKAVVEQFPATADSNGSITIQFTTVVDNAQVNGIEVLPVNASSLQINAGGSAVSPFVADMDFSSGSASSSGNTINTSGVTNAAPAAVYQTNRVGPSFSYVIPNLAASASYTVRLHFAETYWTATGKRVFNVSINGSQVLTSFDIYAAANNQINTAVVKQFSVTSSSSGSITIQFTAVTDQAEVSGLEIISSGAVSTPTSTPVTATPTPNSTNWNTVWNDNFSGSAGTSPTPANWIVDTGTSYPGGVANWGTGEVETMSNSTSNVALDGNNHLNITAVNNNGAWTSGRIESQRSDFAAPAGGMLQISASIKQPNPSNGIGYWPKFWIVGAGYRSNMSSWPGVGEIDVMEDVNGRSADSATLHCGSAPNGPCNEYNGLTSGLATCANCQTGYHTYSIIIDRTKTNEQIRWYIDGQQVWVVSEDGVGVNTWQAAVDHGFYLLFDLAIGGSYPNTVCNCTSPTSATSTGGALSIGAVTVSQITGNVPPTMTTPPVPTGGNVVKVTGTQGNWQLTVNNAPYYIKGVTYGPGDDSATSLAYMPSLQSMGVNTIRTWGTDASTQPLLDAASAYGVKVVAGFWLNQGADYLNDSAYKSSTLTTIQQYVNQYKNHPGLLMWDVGNEVILTMQDHYSGTQVEQERDAYVQYVDQIAQAIHQIDPNHPVTSTDAWTGAWPYYKTYAPHLDLYALNSYGAACNAKQDWINGGYTVPYIVTETGPAGEWEVPNDVNGVPTQETDVQNSQGYATAWNCITGHTGVALGATIFNYGIENDFGGVWFNLLTGHWRRLADFTVAQLYGGTVSNTPPPSISSMTLDQTSVATNGKLNITLNVSNPNNALLRYNVMLCSKYIDSGTGLQYANFTQTGTNTFVVTPPNKIGVWKVYVYVYDGLGNVGVQSLSFKVVPPTVNGTNVALNKTTTASSYQATGDGAPFLPSNATDGNISTRWASDWSDPQWLEVDLGQTTTINHIQLIWESAYASAYQIQVSNDNSTWTNIYSTTTGQGGVDDFNVSGSGRYVRMNGTQRGTTYGYSIYEFGVYH
jgi:Malectin domain/F5/8 type C domain/Glycosyl hydrolases family 2, TIM barrel domain